MGYKRRKRKDQEPLSSPTVLESSSRFAQGGDPPPVADAGTTARKTHTITRLADGTVCIGAECSVVRVAPTGTIEIDVRECDDEVQQLVNSALDKGAGAEVKTRSVKR